MLSVHCMLNQTDFSRDTLPTCSSPITTTTTHHHRSPMLDIASLLCNNNDNDDHLYGVNSSTTTPSLSTVSSPLSTSSSVSFSSSFTNISPSTDHHMPFSITTSSTRSPSPLPFPEQPSYHRLNLTKKHNHYNTKDVCYAPSVSYLSKQQHANTTPYHYQHRLLLMVDDDRDTHRKWKALERAKHVDDDTTDEEEEDDEVNDKRIKTKRRRANNKQLQVLNRVFQHTFFPSTQMRVQLGRQLGMNPRTVQIWFQNRRQALRTKERQRWSI